MHKRTAKWMLVSAALLIISFCVSCLSYKTLDYRFYIHEDLSGKLVLTGTGITSEKKVYAERAEEMKEFYESDWLEIRANFAELGVGNITSRIENKTPVSCNAVLIGSFKNFLPVLWNITKKEDELLFKKEYGKLTVKLPGLPVENGAEKITHYFSLQYQGEILKHNAHFFDQNSNTIRWKLEDLKSQEIFFVLQLPE
jgi:hypothetical protein